MGQWVVTVTGIAILAVLCNVILPEGETRKYVKTVFGVVVSLVMIQPIIGLFEGKIDIDLSTDNGIVVQQTYLDNVSKRKNEIALDRVRTLLKDKNIAVQEVSLSMSQDSLTVKLDTAYNKQDEQAINSVVSDFFPNCKLVLIWK